MTIALKLLVALVAGIAFACWFEWCARRRHWSDLPLVVLGALAIMGAAGAIISRIAGAAL